MLLAMVLLCLEWSIISYWGTQEEEEEQEGLAHFQLWSSSNLSQSNIEFSYTIFTVQGPCQLFSISTTTTRIRFNNSWSSCWWTTFILLYPQIFILHYCFRIDVVNYFMLLISTSSSSQVSRSVPTVGPSSRWDNALILTAGVGLFIMTKGFFPPHIPFFRQRYIVPIATTTNINWGRWVWFLWSLFLLFMLLNKLGQDLGIRFFP